MRQPITFWPLSILPSDHGHITVECAAADIGTPADLLLGFESGSPEFPFHMVTAGKDEVAFAWEDDAEPLFIFRGSECEVRKRGGWRTAVALLLLHRIYRARTDAIFFHASTIAIDGSGAMFIGRKGAGKSTTAMALAGRGHDLLGDETGCYVPSTGNVEAFLRPLGIKPGPRSRFIDAALMALFGEVPSELVRVERHLLLEGSAASSVPLRSIVFLDPFEREPMMARNPAGRNDLSMLQPLSSSLVNAPRTQRVFELARMLAGCEVFRLSPANPDDTAALVERTLRGSAS